MSRPRRAASTCCLSVTSSTPATRRSCWTAARLQLTPSAQADVREPISSSCTANPFNGDGSSLPGRHRTAGTPFFLFTKGTTRARCSPMRYKPATPMTTAASAITSPGATLNGSVNPAGASALASFQYGTTTAYGSTTTPQRLAVANASTPFSAAISGLTSDTTYHFRAVVVTDFGTLLGADRTLPRANRRGFSGAGLSDAGSPSGGDPRTRSPPGARRDRGRLGSGRPDLLACRLRSRPVPVPRHTLGYPRRRWWNGRHDALKRHCPSGRVGSNPTRRIHSGAENRLLS